MLQSRGQYTGNACWCFGMQVLLYLVCCVQIWNCNLKTYKSLTSDGICNDHLQNTATASQSQTGFGLFFIHPKRLKRDVWNWSRPLHGLFLKWLSIINGWEGFDAGVPWMAESMQFSLISSASGLRCANLWNLMIFGWVGIKPGLHL